MRYSYQDAEWTVRLTGKEGRYAHPCLLLNYRDRQCEHLYIDLGHCNYLQVGGDHELYDKD